MGANSLTCAFSLGQQAAIDTDATDFITTLATVSGLQPRFDITESRREHPGAVGSRATAKRAASTRTGYLVDLVSTFVLRPRFIGHALLGAGFTVATTNNTTHYTHVFKLASRATFPWLTGLWYIDDDAVAAFTLKSGNVRLTQLNINASPEEVQCDLAAVGMTEGDAAGTETLVSEAGFEILPTIGTMTVNLASTSFITSVRSINLAIANTLKEDDRFLFVSGRTDLPQEEITVAATLGGVPITRDLYRRIVRGGTSGTEPSLVPPTGDLIYKFQSAANITGASVPYSLQMDLNSVEYTFPDNQLQASEADDLELEVTAEMIDNVTDPIVITLVNDVASYAA
jgi:hypothetical protein